MTPEAPFLFSIAALSASLGLLARPMLAFLLVLTSFEST